MKNYQGLYVAVPKIKTNCLICNDEFYGHSYNKYCSKICRSRANLFRSRNKAKHLKENNQIKLLTLNCKRCSIEFKQKQIKQVFCCKDCSRKYYKENYKMNPNLNAYLKLRFEIFKRDNFRCQYCGRNPRYNDVELVVDHILPRAKNGSSDPANLITSCKECNAGKIDVLLEDKQLSEAKYEK